ncbi:hypothetical protein DFJ73DRAFT_968014 [Zopfochytrium polystomum]|nr:hypothetical protein DFJ73DRAFT_968014 [Zopfochytrium polystomum]
MKKKRKKKLSIVAHQCNFEQLRDCSQVLSVTVAAFAFLALCLVLWGLRLLWSLVCLRRLSGDNDDGQHAQQRRTPSAVVIGLTVFEWSIALAVASKAFFVVGASMALLGFKAVVSSGFLAGQRWGAVSAMILFFEAAILPLSRYEAKIAKLRRFVPYLLIIPLGLIPTIVLRAYLGDRLADAYVLQRTAYATVATNPDAYTAAYAEFSSALTAFRDANYAASLTALFADLPVIAFILVARRYFKITIRDGLGPALFALRRKADQEREELESAMVRRRATAAARYPPSLTVTTTTTATTATTATTFAAAPLTRSPTPLSATARAATASPLSPSGFATTAAPFLDPHVAAVTSRPAASTPPPQPPPLYHPAPPRSSSPTPLTVHLALSPVLAPPLRAGGILPIAGSTAAAAAARPSFENPLARPSFESPAVGGRPSFDNPVAARPSLDSHSGRPSVDGGDPADPADPAGRRRCRSHTASMTGSMHHLLLATATASASASASTFTSTGPVASARQPPPTPAPISSSSSSFGFPATTGTHGLGGIGEELGLPLGTIRSTRSALTALLAALATTFSASGAVIGVQLGAPMEIQGLTWQCMSALIWITG